MNEAEFWNSMQVGHFDECWPWLRAHDRKGYGNVRFEGRRWPAHALADYLTFGAAPKGTQRHHTCGNPPCCNPSHIQRVTPLEHSRLHAVEVTHCPQGHPYKGDNLYTSPVGHRFCLACRRAKDKQRRPDRGLRGSPEFCKHGHPKAGDNLYIVPGTGQHQCRICRAEYSRRQVEREKVKRHAVIP